MGFGTETEHSLHPAFSNQACSVFFINVSMTRGVRQPVDLEPPEGFSPYLGAFDSSPHLAFLLSFVFPFPFFYIGLS